MTTAYAPVNQQQQPEQQPEYVHSELSCWAGLAKIGYCHLLPYVLLYPYYGRIEKRAAYEHSFRQAPVKGGCCCSYTWWKYTIWRWFVSDFSKLYRVFVFLLFGFFASFEPIYVTWYVDCESDCGAEMQMVIYFGIGLFISTIMLIRVAYVSWILSQIRQRVTNENNVATLNNIIARQQMIPIPINK